VKNIGDKTFYDCKRLRKLSIPSGVENVGYLAIEGGRSLGELHLPAHAAMCFSGMTPFVKVYIQPGAEEIEMLSFSECDSVMEIHIPEGVKRIGYAAFRACTSLTRVELPHSLEKIDYEAFEGCTALKSICFPEGLCEIGARAFEENTALEEAVFPDSLVSIGGGAFIGCTALKRLWISRGVSEIGIRAFGGCSELHRILVSEKNEHYFAESNCIVEKASRTVILGCKDSKIPERSDVTALLRTFYGSSQLHCLSIPQNIKYIGESTFAFCLGMEKLYIPRGVKKIDPDAFLACSELKITFGGSRREWKKLYPGNNIPVKCKRWF
jgi:hypothetical protein